MQRVTATVEIDAASERVWAVLADFGNINVFNPNLTKSYLTGPDRSGIGATRHCDLTMAGASIEERIVDWADGERYKVEIYEGTRNPFSKAFATLSVQPLTDTRTATTMTIEWRAKGGLFAGMLDKGLRGANRKAITGVLAGLKHHVETGEAVAARQPMDVTVVNVH